MNESSSWWEWDGEKYTFQRTVDYVFARHHNGGKRIGDMERGELIQVIAVGYHEREMLARALVSIFDGQVADEQAVVKAVSLAQAIVKDDHP